MPQKASLKQTSVRLCRRETFNNAAVCCQTGVHKFEHLRARLVAAQSVSKAAVTAAAGANSSLFAKPSWYQSQHWFVRNCLTLQKESRISNRMWFRSEPTGKCAPSTSSYPVSSCHWDEVVSIHSEITQSCFCCVGTPQHETSATVWLQGSSLLYLCVAVTRTEVWREKTGVLVFSVNMQREHRELGELVETCRGSWNWSFKVQLIRTTAKKAVWRVKF